MYDVNLEANVGQRSRHGAYDIGELAEAPKVIPVNHGGLCDWPAIRDMTGRDADVADKKLMQQQKQMVIDICRTWCPFLTHRIHVCYIW